MKVVLFCGGMGMRMRGEPENVPKPLVKIGYRPIIWHLMRYYAHFGHKDFILCLGYRGDAFKKYFRDYDECLSNDFVLSNGGREIHLYGRDIAEWSITFADTGLHANVGQRLLRVRKYLGDDDVFLANYGDGLTDLHLPDLLDRFLASDKLACFVNVKPNLSFHFVQAEEDGRVTDIRPFRESDIRINGGYFAIRKEFFDYIREGEELVAEPFRRLIADDKLMAYRYDGFWEGMDTFKDKQILDSLHESGQAPWQVWG